MINKFRYRKPQQQQQQAKDNGCKITSDSNSCADKNKDNGILGAKEKKKLKVSWLCNC